MLNTLFTLQELLLSLNFFKKGVLFCTPEPLPEKNPCNVDQNFQLATVVTTGNILLFFFLYKWITINWIYCFSGALLRSCMKYYLLFCPTNMDSSFEKKKYYNTNGRFCSMFLP